MGRIAILADAVADQIAAGEVVERPASVVKELVENALDAGATDITVELEDGGRTLIRVTDDGSGMDRDDAVLCVDRHATSKIRTSADLVGVPTYGFRGEALAAIASVARFELETSTGGEGTLVRVTGGRPDAVEATARGRGTTVTVRRLFFNTPARRKFLRSQRSETRAAVESLTALALARLDVAFRLMSDGRALIDVLRSGDVGERIAALFGRDVAQGLVGVDWNAGPLSVRGFVQRPAEARPTGRKAFLFVNGRPFRDPFLIRAAEAGFRATIAPGLRPTILLSLGLPGDRIDVNVHPAKLEVRFQDRMLVERAVEEAVRAALGETVAAAVLKGGSESGYQYRPGMPDSESPRYDAPDPGAVLPPGAAADLFGVGREPAAPPTGYLQIFNTYILLETPEGLAIVDQHSAQERVLYEQAMRTLQAGGGGAQHLLLPLTIDLSPPELEAFEANQELLKTIGYEAEPFGGSSVIVHAVPHPHPRFDARRCFEELVADLARGRLGGLANRLERFAATYACRAAIKAGQALEQSEMRALIARLFACALPPHDVHGRPTIVQLPKNELERRFGRA